MFCVNGDLGFVVSYNHGLLLPCLWLCLVYDSFKSAEKSEEKLIVAAENAVCYSWC